ncbi:MAG: ABC transporter ATP-binding protein [Proteocatella sp.]
MYVEIKDLSFRYKNSKVDNLKGLDISIEKGEILGILGESGSGKSTVLRILSGLEVASGGSIEIGKDVIFNENTWVPPEKRGIGMVFQDYALFPHMTVAKNIMFGLTKMSKGEKQSKMLEILELVGLTDHKHKYPHELSGGQQQRVAIARAIAPSPSILLLDEPFSNLDANLQEQIRDDLNSILKKANITSILVTHDKEDVKTIADKVVVLNCGKVVKCGLVKDIFQDEI